MSHALFSSLASQTLAPPPAPITRSGTIASSETWGPNQLVTLTGNTKLASGVTLTILPGTTVEYADDYWLEVGAGNLVCDGTASSKITFKPSATNPKGYGYGALLIGQDAGLLTVNPAVGTYSISHCDFTDFDKSKRSNSANARHNMRGAAIMVEIPTQTSWNINSCSFTNCTAPEGGAAIYLQGQSGSRTWNVTSCSFTNCRTSTTEDANYLGGALRVSHGNTLIITGCSYSNNFASGADNIPVTVNASTDTITSPVAHGLLAAAPVYFGGTPPAPLIAGTQYFAIPTSTTALKVATSVANAKAGTAINLTNTGSSVIAHAHQDLFSFDVATTINP